MKKIAFLFPGQGSQKVGMGQDLYNAYSYTREIFNVADEVSGLPITRLCFEGPLEELTQTVNLQPAISAVNLAFLAVLEAQGIKPDICAGHSLGEYCALNASGVISRTDCLKLVFERGRLMHREATRQQGAMSAIIGLDINRVETLVAEASNIGIVAVANHNSAEQIVITGEPQAVGAAADAAGTMGGRGIPLKVSGAWHSPLISGAEEEFRTYLNGISFNAPLAPTLHNVTAATEDNPEQIKTLMVRQLCSPVRWYDSMVHMLDAGVDVYVEIGPGRVLSGLMKKIMPKECPAELFNVFDVETLDNFIEAVTKN